MAKELRYFNFPIQLLEGFLIDYKTGLTNILDYCMYAHAEKLEFGAIHDKIKDAANYYNISLGNVSRSKSNGSQLYDSIDFHAPKAGLNLSIFWDYHNNTKSEFDVVCLVAFLALKSIVQNKPYCKVDNKFWLARMDGKASSCCLTELSLPVAKYANEYQTKKIKKALREWGLVTYSRYTRGFYISFQLTLEELVFQAEKKRKSNNDKAHKERERQAVEQALLRLREPRP